MAAPVLLVADDLALIAAVKRVLAREGYECVLATSAADAVIAFGHLLPGLMLLQPSVEGGRGGVVLDELKLHPDAPLLKAVLLGESIAGHGLVVEPLPIDPAHLAQTLTEQVRAVGAEDGWTVRDHPADEGRPAPLASTPDAWRATRPRDELDLGEAPERAPGLSRGRDTARMAAGDELSLSAPDGDLGVGEAGAEAARDGEPDLGEAAQAAVDGEPDLGDVAGPGSTAQTAAGGELDLSDATGAAQAAPGGELDLGGATGPDGAALAAPGGERTFGEAAGSEGFAEATPDGDLDEATGPEGARTASVRSGAATPPLSAGTRHDEREGDAAATPPATAEVPVSPAITAPLPWSPRRGPAPPPTPAPPAIAPPAVSPPRSSSPSVAALTERLFGDLPSLEDEVHRDVEAEAIASVESSLQRRQSDDELQRLEDEVLAEAQRRRAAREAKAQAAAAPPPVAPEPGPAEPTTDDHTFADLEAPGAAPLLSSSESLSSLPSSRAREVVARAEQMLLEGRAVFDAQGKVDVAERRREKTELEALVRRAEHAEDLVRREREARGAAEETLEQLKESHAALGATLEKERDHAAHTVASTEATAAAELDKARADLESLTDLLAAREAELEAAQAQLGELGSRRDEKVAELTRQREERLAELNRQQASTISELTRRHDERVAALERALAEAEAARELAAQAASGAGAQVAELENERRAHQTARAALAEAEAARNAAELARLADAEARAQAQAQLAPLTARLEAAEAKLSAATELVEEATLQRARLEAEATAAQAALTEARAAVTRLEGERGALADDLERSEQRLAALTQQNARLKDSLDALRTRAEAAEAKSELVGEKVRELEKRELLPVSLPGRAPLGVPRHGTVDLGGMARLMSQLVLAQVDARLELGAAGGTRVLWLKKGLITAALSDFEGDGLIARARGDGLLDARQQAELRLLRTATQREQLEALKARGLVREHEVVALVQRAAEHVALEAFGEVTTQYRLADEGPDAEVVGVTVPRPTLALVTEALRRSLDVDTLLEQLGGGEAVPVATDVELDLRALGFSDRERKMLSWVDGEATVEDVALASGLKPAAAFRALCLARHLGVITLTPPTAAGPAVDAELDVRRLEAKYDEVQDADYFAILGLPRSAGADDVRRAWERLSAEFHPLRFSGHADAGLQQRAQQVFSLLEEAARALEDDRRRVEYARHLLD